MTSSPTAGFAVIGDEILTGKVKDENTYALARTLFERGVSLLRVETIPDDVEEIARTVKRLAERFTFVFTSGGIGPTHDDKTYEGVAHAFGLKLAYRDELLAKMEAHYRSLGKELNEARKRMALLPEGCRLHTPTDLWVPVVVVENVYVLPGVPALFAALVGGVRHLFTGVQRHRVLLYTAAAEGDIADALAREQAAHPSVPIGSYPQYASERSYRVMVTLEGEDAALVEEIAARLAREIAATREPPAAEAAGGSGRTAD